MKAIRHLTAAAIGAAIALAWLAATSGEPT